MTAPEQTEGTELINIDITIDAVARKALEEARRVEEAERHRNNPRPIVHKIASAFRVVT